MATGNLHGEAVTLKPKNTVTIDLSDDEPDYDHITRPLVISEPQTDLDEGDEELGEDDRDDSSTTSSLLSDLLEIGDGLDFGEDGKRKLSALHQALTRCRSRRVYRRRSGHLPQTMSQTWT